MSSIKRHVFKIFETKGNVEEKLYFNNWIYDKLGKGISKIKIPDLSNFIGGGDIIQVKI